MLNNWCEQLYWDLHVEDYENILYTPTNGVDIFNSILCQRLTELTLWYCIHRIDIDIDRTGFWYCTNGVWEKHNIILLTSIIRSQLQTCFRRFVSYIRIHGVYNKQFIALCNNLLVLITTEMYLMKIKEGITDEVIYLKYGV